MSTVRKLKGAFGVLGAITAASSALSSLRSARERRDPLLLANAVANVAVAISGALLAIRALRKGEPDK